MEMNNEFNGKTLVISGGTRGIGRAIVEEFAQNGVNIAFMPNSLSSSSHCFFASSSFEL